jgi:hypothetical protein
MNRRPALSRRSPVAAADGSSRGELSATDSWTQNGEGVWYRSASPTPPHAWPRPSWSRLLRNSVRRVLPDPEVRDRTIVVYARQGLRKRSAWAGLFSEFHHALGALAYAERRGAARVRFDFRSALYVDPAHGPNWWTYFFARDTATIRDVPPRGEVHLTHRLAKYGRYGGFCDLVNGASPYLYPMTYGIGRSELQRLFDSYIGLRTDIRSEADAIIAQTLDRTRFVVGVHYRGTDSNERAIGPLNDYRRRPVGYDLYAEEVRRVLADASADGRGHQLVVATDEQEFVEFMVREFGCDAVTFVADAPRSRAGGAAIHFDQTSGTSNYQKGKSGVIDCLLLSAADYLIKGRSNLSDASLVFNPDLPYSFCRL